MRRKVIKTLLFVLIVAGLAASIVLSQAAEQEKIWLCQKIEEEIANRLKNNFSQWKDARVQVTGMFNKYQLSALEKWGKSEIPQIKVYLPDNFTPASKMVLKIEILNKNEPWYEFYLRNKVNVLSRVCVSRSQIDKRSLLNNKNIMLKEVDISSYKEKLFKRPGDINGWEAKTKIRKNDIILPWMVQPVPVFRYGDEINILYKDEGVKLKFKGKALEDGHVGEKVKCYRINSGKKFLGTVINKNTVLIK